MAGDATRSAGLVHSKEDWLSGGLRQILDALPIPAFVGTDTACAHIFANVAGEQLLRAPTGSNVSVTAPDSHLTRRFDCFGADCAAVPGEDLPVQRAARGEVIHDYEFELRFRNGDRVWLIGNAYPLCDAEGTVWGSIGAFTDITTRKRTERALLRANDAKLRLLEVVSHDLRQPVQGLALSLPLLESLLAAEAEPALTNVRRCVDVLMTQLTSLLDFTRVESGLVPVRLQTVPIAGIIERAAAPSAALATEKGLALRLRPCRALVRTDAALMERLIGNLISNAVKYTRRGGVLVGCRRRGKRLVVQVVDTGIGIPPPQLGSIWDDHFQTKGGHGVGLGLAIVDRTARLLGCQVKVCSAVDRGSTFAVDMPRETD